MKLVWGNPWISPLRKYWHSSDWGNYLFICSFTQMHPPRCVYQPITTQGWAEDVIVLPSPSPYSSSTRQLCSGPCRVQTISKGPYGPFLSTWQWACLCTAWVFISTSGNYGVKWTVSQHNLSCFLFAIIWRYYRNRSFRGGEETTNTFCLILQPVWMPFIQVSSIIYSYLNIICYESPAGSSPLNSLVVSMIETVRQEAI